MVKEESIDVSCLFYQRFGLAKKAIGLKINSHLLHPQITIANHSDKNVLLLYFL